MNMGQFDQCRVCFGFHPLWLCAAFNVMSTEQRQYTVRVHKYCLNCLSKNHFVRACTSMSNCRLCGQRHNTMLHPMSGAMGTTNRLVRWTNTPMQHNVGLNLGVGSRKPRAELYHPYASQQSFPNGEQNQVLLSLQTKDTIVQNKKQKKGKQSEKQGKTKSQKKDSQKVDEKESVSPAKSNKTDEKISQSEMIAQIFNSIKEIASSLKVAPVQGARHVEEQGNTVDELGMDQLRFND
ncbi:uncharacterized protein [Musca autumnalis]|uniref:uncharacterized protein n=1 Tax=Musca autumnalis TaxID=221902 RepID=UPI003CED1BEC